MSAQAQGTLPTPCVVLKACVTDTKASVIDIIEFD
jgi:hypothetical protein